MPTFRRPKFDGSSPGADELAVPPPTSGGRASIDPSTGTGTGAGSRNSGRDAWRRAGEDLPPPGNPLSGGNGNGILNPGEGGAAGMFSSAFESPQATTTTPDTSVDSPTPTPTSDSSNIPATSTSAAAVPSTDSPEGLGVPVWAIVVIVLVAIVAFVFVASLGVFCVRERRKGYERGTAPSYGRAVRRALAAATGAFIPIWIAKRMSSSKSSSRKHPQDTTYAAKRDALLNYELSQASLAYNTPPAAAAAAEAAGPALTPEPEEHQRNDELRPHVQRSASMVSALSSSDSARGRYSRVENDQPLADAAIRGGIGAGAGAGLQRNPSLVSALSSTDEGRGYSAHDIPPPTPMSGNAATFTSPERRRDDPAIRNSACYSP